MYHDIYYDIYRSRSWKGSSNASFVHGMPISTPHFSSSCLHVRMKNSISFS